MPLAPHLQALKAPESFRVDGKEVTPLQTQPGPGCRAPSARSEFQSLPLTTDVKENFIFLLTNLFAQLRPPNCPHPLSPKPNSQNTQSWKFFNWRDVNPCVFPSPHGKQMGRQWKQCQTLFWGAPKSLQMVTSAMKLKDAHSLEGKLWPT